MALTTRQWRLKEWLEKNHQTGRYWTIREICDNVKYTDGSPCYKYDDRIESHDRCVALGNDVRKINWEQCEGWKLIIKDKKGSVKLAESKVEFDEWWNAEHDALENRYKLLSVMRTKADKDGLMPIINMAGNVVDVDKPLQPINSYMGLIRFALIDDKIQIVNVVRAFDIDLNKSCRVATVKGGVLDGHKYFCDRVKVVNNINDARIEDYAFSVLKGGE